VIARLTGVVGALDDTTAIIEVHGVGYEVLCTSGAAAGLTVSEVTTLEIYTDVKEDSIRLYGFTDRLEKRVASLLMKVRGVGAKSASEILSHVGAESLLKMLGEGNVAKLREVKGIGKKTAERLVVELQDIVTEFIADVSLRSRIVVERTPRERDTEVFSDAVAALCALGFAPSAAERSVAEVRNSRDSGSSTDSGEIVREALRII
jgi:holliday junction DNA helicase RuvA